MPLDFWDDRNAHLKEFPDHLLFDIARNDSAQRPYRRHAVEILVVRKSPKVKHPDLADLVAELEIELDGIQFEYPASSGTGPLVASVTTETMQQEDFPQAEFHTDTVPSVLPANSGSVLKVTTDPRGFERADGQGFVSREKLMEREAVVAAGLEKLKETECPITPSSPMSDDMGKPPSTPTVVSGVTKTPR